MEIVTGDLLSIERGIIGHQVNCCRTANAGLARQIKQKYVGWYDNYLHCTPALGKLGVFIHSPTLVVANLYGQDKFGAGTRHTDYMALGTALSRLERLGKYYMLPIYLPYQLGSNLGGGDWEIVLELIDTCCPSATVLRLPERPQK